MFDLPPDLPPKYAPTVVAQASQVQKGGASVDRTIGVCHLATNSDLAKRSAINSFGPVAAAYDYLRKEERRNVELSGTMTILSEPTHGKLENLNDEHGNLVSYLYVPTDSGYVGLDQATFLVEIGGYKVKVMYFFNVSNSLWGGTDGYDPYEDKKYCPKGGMWKISFNTKSSRVGTLSVPTRSSIAHA